MTDHEDQEDPFKKYGGSAVADQEDPFKRYGGSAIAEPVKKKVGGIKWGRGSEASNSQSSSSGVALGKVGATPTKTPEQSLSEIGLNFTFKPKDVLAPVDNFNAQLPKPYEETKHIDLNKGDDVAVLSESVEDKINKNFKGGKITDLEARYGTLNPSFLKKYPETDKALKSRKELMPVITEAAQSNAYKTVVGDKPAKDITREDLQKVALEFQRQINPSGYKRQKMVVDAGKDLGDENKYNLEKLGTAIASNNVDPEDAVAKTNLYIIDNETDKAHPEYTLAKAMELVGSYNHLKDNKANNGFWRTRPTIGEVKRWIDEDEFIKMFAGNEGAYDALKEKISALPGDVDKFRMDDVPISGGLNRFGQALGTGLENVGNLFDSDVYRQQSNLNPTIGRGTFTGNYRLPGQTQAFNQRVAELQDKDKNSVLIPEEQLEYNALKKATTVRSGWDKFVDASSDITGQVVMQAIGTKGIGALSKLPTNISAGITTALNSYDPIRKQAVYLFPDDPDKQNIYTGGMVAANALSERIFKDEKLIDAFKSGVKNDIAATVKNLSAKEVSRQELKNILGNNLLKFGGETVKKSSQEGLEESIVQAVDESLQGSLGAEGYDQTQAIKNIGETYLTTLLNGSVVAGIASSPSLRNNQFNSVGLYRMAFNPEISWKELNRLHELGELSPDELSEKSTILNKAVEISNNEPENISVLPTKKRAEYLSQTLNAQLKSEQAENTKNKNKAADIQAEALESENKATELYKEGTEDLKTLEVLKSKAGELEQGVDLQYFQEKAAEDPSKYIEKYGKDVVNNLIKDIPVEVLKSNLQMFMDVEAYDHPSVRILEDLIDQKEPSNPPIDQVREMADENTPDEISQPIELNPELPEGYELPAQPTQEFETNIPSNENIEKPVEIVEPVTTEKEVITEPIPDKDSGGAIPPKEEKQKSERRQPLREKGILSHLHSAENIPELSRAGFEKEGLKYKTKSQKEAQGIAKSIIDFAGVDQAVEMAEAQKFDGDVNSLIFGEALNEIANQELLAETPEEKMALAKKFAAVGMTYDEMARKGGRFNSAIDYFYRKSPLGIVMMENAKRAEEFTEWSKPKDKSWKEFFGEMMKEPEFETIVKEQVQAGIKEGRAKARETRIKNVSEAIDKAKDKFKGGAAYSTIIPPKVITTALEGIKQAYIAGENVVKIVQDAIDYISGQLGHDNWDKDKFRQEWEKNLKDNKKAPLTDDELKLKVLEKFRKKLSGLSDKDKDEVIRKSYKKIVDSGGLDYQDFRDIIGEVTGRKALTQEEAERIKELVQITNSVDEAAQKAREERTPESIKAFRETENKAGKAAKELQDIFNNKPDIVRRLTSIMQLNTLGIASLVNNPIYNIWNQATLRFPVGAVNSAIDLFGKRSEQEYNIIASQAEFWNKLGLGSNESIKQLFTGLDRMDYIAKEVQGDRIRPFKSLRDLFSKKKLSGAEKVDKILQGTVGVPAEIVARLLNIGDKPQRFSAEGAQAAAFAKALGLKEMDYKLFIEFPIEEAYRAYKAQGLSDEEAGKKADYVKEAIVREGKRSTFQQENLFNDALNRFFGVFGGKDSGTANLLKTVTVSPYVKIPSNAFWSFYNLLNPEIAILQSIVHKGRSGYFKNKGEYVKQKMQNREARYWLAHAVVGMAARAVVLGLVQQGIFTPSSDEDDTKKQRDALALYGKGGSFKVGDTNVSGRWWGQWGQMFNSIANKQKDMTPEEIDNQDTFWRTVFGGMEIEGLKEVENGLLANTSSLLESVDGGNFDRYLTNMTNMFTNIIHPASVAQFNRAGLDEVPSGRGDNLIKKIDQQFAQRSPLYRAITGTRVEDKLDIWGQPIPKGGNRLSRMFGYSKDEKNQFGRPIYEDAIRSGDAAFLPPAVLPTLNGEKLKEDVYRDLQNRIGTERKNLVAPYVNDMSTIEGFNTKYSELSDEDKKYVLTYLYNEGRDRGLEKFYQDHPELKKETPEKDYQKEAQQDIFKILQKYK